MPNITYNTKRFFITRWTNSLYFLLKNVNWIAVCITLLVSGLMLWMASTQITGCKFQVPQNLRRLINVYAINFMP